MSDDPRPHSGSRWEPAPSEQAPTGGPDGEAATRPVHSDSTDPAPDSAPDPKPGPAPDPTPDPIVAALPAPRYVPPAARRNRRRTGLLAAAAAGLLALGGIGGYGIGHATAGDGPPRAGLVDAGGDRGHHRDRADGDSAPGLNDGPSGGPGAGAPANATRPATALVTT